MLWPSHSCVLSDFNTVLSCVTGRRNLGRLRWEIAALGAAADAARISDILLGLAEGETPPTATATIAPNAAAIERCFSALTAEEILDTLSAEPGEWAAETVATLRRMSPLSIKLTIEACRRHAKPDCTISDALVAEYAPGQGRIGLAGSIGAACSGTGSRSGACARHHSPTFMRGFAPF